MPNVISETDADNQINYNYIYGLGLISQIDHENNQRFYHFDPTGHTIALSDEDEEILDKYAYTPYGETTVNGDGYNPFRYVGKYGVMDDGNGVLYMRARYYNVNIKRFCTKDAIWGSISNPQTNNQYNYVLGDPIRGVDPHGLKVLWDTFDLSLNWEDSKDFILLTLKESSKIIGVKQKSKVEEELEKALLSFRKEDFWSTVEDDLKKGNIKRGKFKLEAALIDKAKTFICIKALSKINYEINKESTEEDMLFIIEACQLTSSATNLLILRDEKVAAIKNVGKKYKKTQVWSWVETEANADLSSKQYLEYIKSKPNGPETHDVTAATIGAVLKKAYRIIDYLNPASKKK